jgi:transcriptional regulator GlxA family with amidase domain
MFFRFTLFLLMLIITGAAASAQVAEKKPRVAILVYEGVYLLDYCGPMEVFSDTWLNDSTQAFEVYTVSPDAGNVRCHTGMVFTPTYTFENCPQADILVVPGGNPNLLATDKKIGPWIRAVSEKSKITMSVCTGAFILAGLGMLDGLEAATWYGAADRLQKKYPKIIVRKDKRFTDNGRILTTTGISAGIDGSLHVVSRLFGKDASVKTAQYMQYECQEK